MFDDMELLDFAGPYEVFTTAQRMAERACAAGSPPGCGFEVSSMSMDGGDVRAALRDEALLSALAERTARQMDVRWTEA
jgi:putative intracellular protease/amidase